jgi:hypothetical protein
MESTGEVAWPWRELEVEADADERMLRRAYARILKERRVDEDVEAFQRLRSAYELALNLAKQHRVPSGEPLLLQPEAVVPTATRIAQAASQGLTNDGDTPVIDMPQTSAREPSLRVQQPEAVPATAGRLWGDFIWKLESRDTQVALAELFDGVVSLTIRDELERLALAYCLRDDVSAARCGDFAKALGWHDDAKHLLRIDPVAVQRVLSKAAVKDNFAALSQRFPRAMARLTDGPCGPAEAFWVLGEQRMRAEMEKLLAMLRGYYADVMRWEIDAAAVAFWTERTAAQRRCEQGWVRALLVGGCIGVLLALAVGEPGATRFERLFSLVGMAIVGVSALLHVVLGCTAALLRPTPRARIQRLLGTQFGRLGWIVLWHCAIVLAIVARGVRGTESASILLLAIALDWSIIVVSRPGLRRYLMPAMAVAFCTGLFGYLAGVADVLVPVTVVHGFLVATLFDARQISNGALDRRIAMLAFAWAGCSIALAGLLLAGVSPPFTWAAYALLLVWCPAFAIPRRLRTALFEPAHAVGLLMVATAGMIGRFPADAAGLVFVAVAAFAILFVLSISFEGNPQSSPWALLRTVVIGMLAAVAGRFAVPVAVAMLLGADVCMASHLYRLTSGPLDAVKGMK